MQILISRSFKLFLLKTKFILFCRRLWLFFLGKRFYVNCNHKLPYAVQNDQEDQSVQRLVGCGLDISFNVAVFSESVTQSSFRFTDVKLIAIRASYAVNKIGGGTRKVISDLNEYLESRCFLYVITEIASFVS